MDRENIVNKIEVYRVENQGWGQKILNKIKGLIVYFDLNENIFKF